MIRRERWFNLRKKEIRCPECGEIAGEPKKTWHLVAPFPDKKGRITVTVMGAFECKKCGKKYRSVVSKVKIGPGGKIEK